MDARKWAEIPTNLLPNRYSFWDTRGQIEKKELKALKDEHMFSSLTEQSYCIEVACKAIKFFQEAQSKLEAHQSNRSAGIQASYLPDSSFTPNASYFGEIDVSLNMSELLLTLTDNQDKKKTIVRYLMGQAGEKEVEITFDKFVPDWRDKYSHIFSQIDTKIKSCSETISQTFDSTIWKKKNLNPLYFLTRINSRRESLFFGDKFESIPKEIKKKSFESLREHFRGHQVDNLISCFMMDSQEFSKFKDYMDCFMEVANEEDLTNEDKIFFLNLEFGDYYRNKKRKIYEDKNGEKMKKIRQFSKQVYQAQGEGSCRVFFLLHHFSLAWRGTRFG